ncbi:MAG: HNH endonuclease [Anaerolineaceae bacterium]|nr:HNH endonuclease [Anaerolineaceae bacterium]
MTYIPESLRDQVEKRAQSRCEYCHLHENHAYFVHEIDHIYAEKHGGETREDNLCLACSDCNRRKGSNLCSLDPQTGKVVTLFHPRLDKWDEHFHLEDTGMITPLSSTGRVTERVLGFNRLELVIDRARLIALGSYKDQDS